MAENQLMPFQVTICGIDELEGHCAGGVTHVLSILDPGWPEPDWLSRFDINRRLRLRFHNVMEVAAWLDRAEERSERRVAACLFPRPHRGRAGAYSSFIAMPEYPRSTAAASFW